MDVSKKVDLKIGYLARNKKLEDEFVAFTLRDTMLHLEINKSSSTCQHLWSHTAKEVINTVILPYFTCQGRAWCSNTETKICFFSNPQGNNWEDKRIFFTRNDFNEFLWVLNKHLDYKNPVFEFNHLSNIQS